MGQHVEAVGPEHRPDNPSLRRPHQGRAQRRVLSRQPSDRVGFSRQDDQAVEHARRMQVHDPGMTLLRGPAKFLVVRPDVANCKYFFF